MAINKKILCFLASFSLFYINPGAATTPTPTDVSCQAPGTVNVSVSDGLIGSVLVECEYKGNNTVRTIQNSGPTDSISVPNCTINKPVKLVLFNDTHNESLGAVIKKDESHVVKEIIVICNGSHMTVKESFNNSVLAPSTVTNIPLRDTLTMKVTDETGKDLPPAVDLALNYTVRITGPENLFLLVESCDAASDLNFKNDLVSLYVNRKPNSVYGVLGTFSNNTATSTEATMVGFRLLDSPVVYLRCVVDVCDKVSCPSLTTSTTTTTPTMTTTTTTTPTTTTTTTTSTTPTTTTSTTTTTTITTTTTTTPTTTITTTTISPPLPRPMNQPSTAKHRRRRNVDTTNRTVTLSTSFRVEPLFTTTSGVNGPTIGDNRYAFIASLLLAKYFLSFR